MLTFFGTLELTVLPVIPLDKQRGHLLSFASERFLLPVNLSYDRLRLAAGSPLKPRDLPPGESGQASLMQNSLRNAVVVWRILLSAMRSSVAARLDYSC